MKILTNHGKPPHLNFFLFIYLFIAVLPMHSQLNPWRQITNPPTGAWINYWDPGNLVVNLPTFTPTNGVPTLMLHSFYETTDDIAYPASIIMHTEKRGDSLNLFGENYIEFWSNHYDSTYKWQTGLISSYTNETGSFDTLNKYYGGLKFGCANGPSRLEAEGGPVDVMYIYDKKVGIWRNDPKEKLHVGGWIRSDSLAGLGFRTVLATDDGTLVTSSAFGCINPWCTSGNQLTTDDGSEYLGSSNSFSLIIKTDDHERMRVNEIGNVTIGRENWAESYIAPIGRLDVNVGCWDLQSSKISFDVRGTYQGQKSKESSMEIDSTAPSIRFYRPTGTDTRRSYHYWIELRDLFEIEKSDPGFSLDFLSNTSTTYMGEEEPTTKVRFMSNGNVGIGDEIVPEAKLHVDGNVIIGSTTIIDGDHTDFKLSVDGKIVAQEIIVTLDDWGDYVFDEDYNLIPLDELESLIKKNNHLPEIPSSDEVLKNGVSIGEMQAKLLKKIEELTLYIIELKKENTELNNRVNQIENRSGGVR